jgi:hypothetical protein
LAVIVIGWSGPGSFMAYSLIFGHFAADGVTGYHISNIS